MKKLLALLLSVMMIFSTVGVFAEEVATEDTTTEEVTIVGSIANIDGTSARTFSDSYTTAPTYTGSTYQFKTSDNYRVEATYHGASKRIRFSKIDETDLNGETN